MAKVFTVGLVMMAAMALGLSAQSRQAPFQKVVPYMDMQRFLGSWYVIGLLPTPFEKDAANGIETYSLDKDGIIRVEYVFRKGSPSGKPKVMHQKGWIMDKASNTEWKVQPLWPLRLPYLVIELAEDYRYVVIGTNNYKYVWIMARQAQLSESDYAQILSKLELRGYKVADIKKMPQVW